MAGEGERLHAERRRRFWLIIGGLAGVGAIGGFVGGLVMKQAAGAAMAPWISQAAAAGVVLVAILAAYGSWRFFLGVDEVEVADNLWGSLIGFYAYAILFPSWWALARLGRAPEPDDWLIYGASMAVALAVYGWRKWRFR